MNATWFVNSPIRYNPEIALPEFHILSLEHGYCDGVFQYTLTANGSRTGRLVKRGKKRCFRGFLLPFGNVEPPKSNRLPSGPGENLYK